MNRVKKILMERDSLTAMEAEREIRDFLETFNLALVEGVSNPDDLIVDILGLEPDYLEDLLYGDI